MIVPLSADEAAARAQAVGAPPDYATSNVFVRLLHTPHAGAALGNLIKTMGTKTALAHRHRELIILRLGWRMGAEYVFCRHVQVSLKLMPMDDILAVRDKPAWSRFDERDQVVLALTDDLLDGGAPSTSTATALERLFDPDQRVEAVMAVATWRAVATVTLALSIPLEAGIAGWPEDRPPP